MDSCRAVESEFDKAVKKLSINTVGIEKVISKLTAFRDELKNSECINVQHHILQYRYLISRPFRWHLCATKTARCPHLACALMC